MLSQKRYESFSTRGLGFTSQMTQYEHLPSPVQPGQALTALAPMQDVTDITFMGIIADCGSPDYFFTEYFRAYDHSRLDKHILRSITENKTNRPVFAQLIGENIFDLVRSAQELCRYNIAGIDLNMGCPAPRVYRKNVGGGLLRDPEKVNEILGELRAAVPGRFTVKMRVGFADTDNFERILDLINLHNVDLLSLHGRTVKEMYQSIVHYDLIAQAVKQVNCPVLANGSVSSSASAVSVLAQTGAAGVMVGRGAIRNPWIFKQIRQQLSGQPVSVVTLAEVRQYIDRLYRTATAPTVSEQARVNCLKKYLNFIGQGVDTTGIFLKEMRLTRTERDLFKLCDRHLLTDPHRAFE